MRSFLSESELGFGPGGPGGCKLVFRPQIPRLRYVLKFNIFIRFKL